MIRQSPRVGYELFGANLGLIQVAARHLYSAMPQLTPHADRAELRALRVAVRVHDVSWHVRERFAYRGEALGAPVDSSTAGCNRDFRWTIHVVTSDMSGQGIQRVLCDGLAAKIDEHDTGRQSDFCKY
eukprot:scaffold32972_cov28-Tisochrysis_lutea.AAC.2